MDRFEMFLKNASLGELSREHTAVSLSIAILRKTGKDVSLLETRQHALHEEIMFRTADCGSV